MLVYDPRKSEKDGVLNLHQGSHQTLLGLAVRSALREAGHEVTAVIDRDYFWAIYFKSPGGILFEVATGEPGFDLDLKVGVLLAYRGEHFG